MKPTGADSYACIGLYDDHQVHGYHRLYRASLWGFLVFLCVTVLPNLLLWEWHTVREQPLAEKGGGCPIGDLLPLVHLEPLPPCADTVHFHSFFSVPVPVADFEECDPVFWYEVPMELHSRKTVMTAGPLDEVKLDIAPMLRETSILADSTDHRQWAGLAGKVVLWVRVDAKGEVLRHQVRKDPHPYLTAWAERHIVEMRFSPAIFRRQPVRAWVTVSVEFRPNRAPEWRLLGSSFTHQTV
jgi:hypothetical protein